MSTRYRYTPEQIVSKQLRTAILERDAATCQYCGRGARIGHYLYVDHIIPAACGGPAQPYNLVVACVPCNQLKARHVWVPRNLIAITADHLEWRAKIQTLADQEGHQGTGRLDRSIGTVITQAERAAVDRWVDHTGTPIGQLVRAALRAYGLFTFPGDTPQAARDEAAEIAEDMAELERQIAARNPPP